MGLLHEFEKCYKILQQVTYCNIQSNKKKKNSATCHVVGYISVMYRNKRNTLFSKNICEGSHERVCACACARVHARAYVQHNLCSIITSNNNNSLYYILLLYYNTIIIMQQTGKSCSTFAKNAKKMQHFCQVAYV